MGIVRLLRSPASPSGAAIDPDATNHVAPVDRGGEEELRRLADALSSLLARDGDDPPLWWSATFSRRVESARSVIATVTSGARLSAGLDRPASAESPARTRFESDARRLARDAVAVAIAIRWLEVCHDQALPSWPELLRRRSLAPRSADRRSEVALRFG